ncbi:hypothetical protein ACN28S_21115 [Cystobacter fuscus]
MTDFLAAILAFPTVLFTIPLGVVVGYWLTVIVGAVGIDVLDGGDMGGALEGGAKGAIEGGAKAALEGHAHGSFLDVLGFGGVPTTVSVSFVVFLSWLLSLAVGRPLQALLGALPGVLVTGGRPRCASGWGRCSRASPCGPCVRSSPCSRPRAAPS